MIKNLKQRLTMPINNVQRRRIDRKKLSPLAGGVAGRLQQMTQIGNERVNSQAKIPFRERSSFRAFVLAILSEEATATYQSRAENSVFMDQAPPPIIFRIPEMHACIPAPNNLSRVGAEDAFFIDAHPVALPASDDVMVPKLGALVNIVYDDPVNMIGPRYLGPSKGKSAEKTKMDLKSETSAMNAIGSRFSNISVGDYDKQVNIGAGIQEVVEE
jgi:hypothetical protein